MQINTGTHKYSFIWNTWGLTVFQNSKPDHTLEAHTFYHKFSQTRLASHKNTLIFLFLQWLWMFILSVINNILTSSRIFFCNKWVCCKFRGKKSSFVFLDLRIVITDLYIPKVKSIKLKLNKILKVSMAW